MTDLTSLPWRTGRHLGRTVYARTGGDDWEADTVIGMMDMPGLAEEACASHNAELVRRKTEAGSVLSYADPLFREFAKDITVRIDRLETQGMMPEAICLRSGLWPELGEMLGYPVVRVSASSPKTWGVLA